MNMPTSALAVGTAQKISLGFGAFYVLIGLLGFTPLVTFEAANPSVRGPGPGGLLFGIFAVNAIHNIAHLVVGAAMIWAGMSRPHWDLLTKALAIVFVLLVGASFVAPMAEGIAINLPDTVLHLVTALVFGYFAIKVPEDDFVATR